MKKIDRPWQTLDKFVEISSPWLKLIGEHLRDDRQRVIEYWRVEKADSAIALTLQNDKLLLPLPQGCFILRKYVDSAGNPGPHGPTPPTLPTLPTLPTPNNS